VKIIKRIINEIFFKIIHFSYKKTTFPYTRYNDLLSRSWYLTDEYEKHINSTIKTFKQKGYSDFFIDIGANIGLTTINNYQDFKKIFCFEPNETVFNILKSNLKICCDSTENITLFNYGIGANEGNFELMVPKNNFGGAFIVDSNAYSKDTLAKKDGFKSFERNNYYEEKIEVVNERFLKNNVFNQLSLESKGVIKIDVEGYELQVVELIIKSLKCSKYVIIFENWKNIAQDSFISIIKNNNKNNFDIFIIKSPKIFGISLPYFFKSKMKKINPDSEFLDAGSDVILHFH
jgi:FkbM family methyltransferase